MLWDNGILRAKLASHAEAPNLLWQGVRVNQRNRGEGFELTVACKNDGPTARIDRASVVEATFTWSFSDKPPQSVPISWEGFDTGGYVETGVFNLNMLCPKAEEAADHKVTWRVVYWDSRHGYVTECSALVLFVLNDPKLQGTPDLDHSSPDERNRRYKRQYRKGDPGRSSRRAPRKPRQRALPWIR